MNPREVIDFLFEIGRQNLSLTKSLQPDDLNST